YGIPGMNIIRKPVQQHDGKASLISVDGVTYLEGWGADGQVCRHRELLAPGSMGGIGPGKAPLEPPRDLHQDEIARDPLAGPAKTGWAGIKRLNQLHLTNAEGRHIAHQSRLHFYRQDGLWRHGWRPGHGSRSARLICRTERTPIPGGGCRCRGRLRGANGAT